MPRLTKLLFRRDTAANWTSTNPTLDSGEAGYDTTNQVLKIGDGSATWTNLPEIANSNIYGFTSGIYYFPPSYPSDSSYNAGIDNLRAVAFPVSKKTTFDRIGIEVAVGGSTGAVIRLGIYADNGGRKPTTLILDAGTIDATTTGSKEITISQTLTPGLYWLAAVMQGAVSQYRGRNAPYIVPPQTTMGNQNVTQWEATGITGALTSSPTWATNQNTTPKIYLRAQ